MANYHFGTWNIGTLKSRPGEVCKVLHRRKVKVCCIQEVKFGNIWHKRRELWASNTWILHHDNAPAHAALSVRQFLATKQVTILDHPPYSPDLAPCDYFLFPKLKGTIKGTHFEGVEDIKSNVMSFLKRIMKENFAECFPGMEKADGEVH